MKSIMNSAEADDDPQDERAPLPQSSAEVQTRFAWLRTRMALQSTLAAWVRTATSLIGFGFAIVQFLERLDRPVNGPKTMDIAPVVGLVLIGTGSLTTVIAIWEYRVAVKYLESDGYRNIAGIPTLQREPPDVALWIAVLVCLIGVLAFALILTTTELRWPS